MPQSLSGIRWKVLIVRSMLGIVFGLLLARLFFSAASAWMVLVLCALLIFFSYAFESTRGK